MRTNPKIRELFGEISLRALELSNTRDENRKYLRRIVDIYTNKLNDNERVFVLEQLLIEVSHRVKLEDPERATLLYSIRLKFVFQALIGTGVVILFAGIVFRTNPHINSIIDSIGKSFMMLGA